MKPVILVTSDRRAPSGLKPGAKVRPHRPEAWIGESYVQAVRDAGGLPLVVPPGEQALDALLAVAHGVVLTGGHFDIHPSLYGEQVDARLDRVEPARTSLELALARACLEREVPLLGVCGGEQAMVVAAGGTLVQDIGTQIEHALEHEQPTDPATPWHPVRMEGPMASVLGTSLQVNSTHHQAARAVGALEACGWSPDGVVEAVWAPGHPFALGVQWHPELLGDLSAYRALVEASGSRSPTGRAPR